MPRILIVEDNEMNRDMLSRRLERRGYTTLLAIDGETGIDMARLERPDLILMDMSLPGIDGWEATRLLKADPNMCKIPIIALTAHAMSDDRDRSISAGCDDYDTKPVDINRLLAKIEHWLSASGVNKPAVDAPAVLTEVAAEAPPLSSVPAVAKILLVEDNEMNRDMLSRRMSRRGYEVITANDGEQGVNLALTTIPDLILMDMSLPGLDGWEATRLIKTSPDTSSIPIIALTAHAMSTDREKAVQAGCDDFDTKPVEIDRLLIKIDDCLRKFKKLGH